MRNAGESFTIKFTRGPTVALLARPYSAPRERFTCGIGFGHARLVVLALRLRKGWSYRVKGCGECGSYWSWWDHCTRCMCEAGKSSTSAESWARWIWLVNTFWLCTLLVAWILYLWPVPCCKGIIILMGVFWNGGKLYSEHLLIWLREVFS